MGFENTLTALYEHPENAPAHRLHHRLSPGLCEAAHDNLHPDVIFSRRLGHQGCFVYAPGYVAGILQRSPTADSMAISAHGGCIAVHHADSYLAPIVDDMAEIGIQVWQGSCRKTTSALQRHLGGKIGAHGRHRRSHMSRSDATPEEIRSYTEGHPVCLCARGPFHPSITYGLPRAPSILISTGISMRPSMPTTPGSTCRPLTCRCPGAVLPRKKQERLPQRSRRRPVTFFPPWPEFSSGASRRRCWLLRSRPFPWA